METIHDKGELVDPVIGDSEQKYKPFNPEAAERARAEWRAEHPDAVDDPEQARAMAQAGNGMRTMAIKSREDEKLWKGLSERFDDPLAESFAQHSTSDSEFFDQSADRAEQVAGRVYKIKKELGKDS